jgi:DNA-binding PucR family transcriptional regulator
VELRDGQRACSDGGAGAEEAWFGSRWNETVLMPGDAAGLEVTVSEVTMETGALVPVAEAIAPRLSTIVGELLELLLREVDELRRDEFVAGRLRASLDSNMATLLHLMEQPVDLHLVEPPAGALQFAQRLAQRGVPFSALWRAYHLANARFFVICLTELTRHTSDVADLAERTRQLSTLLNAYVDHVCARVGRSYDMERERWLRQQDAVRTERIHDLLAGRVGDLSEVETALGYRMAGRHVGVILWDAVPGSDGRALLRLQQMVTACAERAGCRHQPLVVPRDQSTVWAWLPMPDSKPVDCADVLARLLSGAATSSVRAAVGDPGVSVEGFSRTHRHASVAQAVAATAGDAAAQVTPYMAVAAVSFLCQDFDRARDWVRDTLGRLAVDDEAHARLRDSVSAFLDTGGSLSAAADRLGCHKNTVQHRIRRAEEELGRSVRDRRVDLELALQACSWLGPAVLVAPPAR